RKLADFFRVHADVFVFERLVVADYVEQFTTELFNAFASLDGGISQIALIVAGAKRDNVSGITGSSSSGFGPNRVQNNFGHFVLLTNGWFNGRFGFSGSRATSYTDGRVGGDAHDGNL
ncbi:hypothetical protein DMO24_24230, partial [Modestobacter versicolor]